MGDIATLVETARYEALHGSAIGCAGLVKNLADAVAALTAENERLDRAQRDHFTLREELRIACDTGMRLNLPAGQIVARIRDSLGADAARFAIRDRERRAALPSSRETTDGRPNQEMSVLRGREANEPPHSVAHHVINVHGIIAGLLRRRRKVGQGPRPQLAHARLLVLKRPLFLRHIARR